MSNPHDPNATADIPASSVLPDSLDAGLAAGFGRPAAPRSSLGDLRPVLLKEAEGESAHIVKPQSDAMPPKAETGDRYRLDGEIARGGMGAVLSGRDVDLGRDLAVKVLLEKYANRPEIARRFIEEAQIGGQLQHPGVVPVYDIGRFGDRPFFTMKLVKGVTLAHDLGKREQPTEDRPRLLGIALKVSETLAYAHAKGVIHRDLKPANIMVGAFGEVQVMDWGLAKVLAEGGIADEERASRAHQEPEDATKIRTARSSGSTGGSGTDTEAGSILGTLAYMPPEQANGNIAHLDRRADVFGLGAILCEILTGKPPYVGRSGEEVRRKAVNGDLADSTARLDACEADAELIALTKACLSPEAIDRPKDARAVTDRLSAYLNGVQERLHKAELAEVEARAKSIEERKRHRVTMALAGTVLLAMTLGGGGWLWVKADRDARQLARSRDVNDAINKSTAFREQAKTANVGNALLFAQAREQAQRALALVENGPADAALKDQVARLQAELDEEEKDGKLIAALDEARLAQAETLSENRFASERAVPIFRDAFRAYGLPAGEGEPGAAAARIKQRPESVRDAIVAALDEWDALACNPKYPITEPHLEWLRAVLEAAEPDDVWGRKVRAARRETELPRRQAMLEALAASADVQKVPVRALTRLANPGQFANGNALRPAEAAKLLRRAQRQYPADFWVNHDLGVALGMLTPPEREEAVRFLTAAVALRPDSPGACINLGGALGKLGNNRPMDEEIACFQKAIALDPKYAAAHYNLGNALRVKGDLDGAIACFRKAIALDSNHAEAHNNLGIGLKDKGQLDEAIASYMKAIEISPKLVQAHVCLGAALGRKGQVDEEIACYQKAIALDPKCVAAHFNLGCALNGKGQVDGAIASYQKAIEFDPKLRIAHNSLGNAYLGKGQIDEAIASYKKAIELDPKNADAHGNLGLVLAGKGRLEEAIASYKKAIELDPTLALGYFHLGNAYLSKGQVDEAIAYYKKAVALDPKDAEAHYNLGNALSDLGRVDEALASYKKVIELDPKNAQAHCNLGLAMQAKGRFTESLALLQRGHELGTKQRDWPYPSEEWVRQAEQMAALEGKLPAFLTGEYKPRDAAEWLGLAKVCQAKKLHHAASRLCAGAFPADPKLADDLKAGHRYNAACSAVLAAAGEGEDAGKLDDKEKARLRTQALDWLRADLALWTKLLENGPPAARAAAQQTLTHWQKDADLAGLRDPAALAKLPAEEQKAFTQLWTDVAALLKQAEAKGNPAPPPGTKPVEKTPAPPPPEKK